MARDRNTGPQNIRRGGDGMKTFLIFIVVFLAVLALAAGAFYMVLTRWLNSGGAETTAPDPSILTTEPEQTGQTTQVPGETSNRDTDSAETSSPETTPDKVLSYTTKNMKKSDINRGELILVSNVYEYVFPEKESVTVIYGKKSSSYKLSSSLIKLESRVITALSSMLDAFVEKGGKSDVIVTGAYRSYDEQKEKYEAYAEKHGEQKAEGAVAKPGSSDHHTGLGVDLKVYNDEGKMLSLDDSSDYNWIGENCHKYGFILRFPANKKDITNITYTDSRYYRYVGIPHAEIMTYMDLCVEEYVMYLKDYPFDGEHLKFTSESGKKYEIYYQDAVSSDIPVINVPSNASYAVSGNNIDGFIITAEY